MAMYPVYPRKTRNKSMFTSTCCNQTMKRLTLASVRGILSNASVNNAVIGGSISKRDECLVTTLRIQREK